MKTKTRRIVWQFVIIAMMTIHVSAQSALNYFTNQATAQLQQQFGFGATNIPVYCATNPAIAYNASIHYVLQGIANAYDATTPATNPPSVFRPTFQWQSNTLYISGYACVGNDGYAQIERGFKQLSDPTITTNDNVWGIPWVVGVKGFAPAFNEYCYASAVSVSRELQFVRRPSGTGTYLTNLPPEYTNQFYVMSISNAFGAEAWNCYPTPFTNNVTLAVWDQISITLTNGYNFGTNIYLTNFSYQGSESWAPWNDSAVSPAFKVAFETTATPLPFSYWSESTPGFVSLPNDELIFLPADTRQIGWPVHDWTLTVTNEFIYALIDNDTMRVLDFVNLAPFGSSLNINQALSALSPSPNLWTSAPATDLANSPISTGAMNQIYTGILQSIQFFRSLVGQSGGFPNTLGTFFDPVAASAMLNQSCSWQAANPFAHYTIQDLTSPVFNESVSLVPQIAYFTLTAALSNSPCSLGKLNPDYAAVTTKDEHFNLSGNLFQLEFCGATDLPYSIWASTNLLDWDQIGTASQPAPGSYQFNDPAISAYSNRFYQVRFP